MKHILLLLSFMLLFSCSRVELVYQFAPKVISDKIDGAFDFKSDRYKEVRHQVETDLKTNKKEIIKNVNELFDALLVLSDKQNLTTTDFQNLSVTLRAKQKILIALFKPSFEKVILGLTEEETKSLFKFSEKTISKNDEELRKKSPFADKRLEGFEKLMDYFFDGANSQQKALYGEFIQNNFEYFKAQSAARKEFVTHFSWPIENKAKLNEYVMQYYGSESSVRSSDYTAQLSIFEKNMIQLELDVWKTLTQKQKDFLKTKLTTLKTDLIKLAEK